MKYNTYDEHCQKYAELCNFFWFLLKRDQQPTASCILRMCAEVSLTRSSICLELADTKRD